ncbi:hypothetical protein [Acetobacter malorum]|uniref:hypothetical protein n=1 Tax=Acetobacter malorum TaxID=178901 RepID=UPI00117841BD|nr:hypothetical protein [Acetobacter malorum]
MHEDFSENESGFQEWQRNHPDGVFVNSTPGKLNPNYLVAHKSNCRTVSRHTGRTTVYSKHCFDSLADAQAYLAANCGKQASTGCNICHVGKSRLTAVSG